MASLLIVLSLFLHSTEQYFSLPVKSIRQNLHCLTKACLFGDFELLTLTAHDREQYKATEFDKALGTLLKVRLHEGLEQVNDNNLVLAFDRHSGEQ